MLLNNALDQVPHAQLTPLNHHLSLADHLQESVMLLNNALDQVLHAQLTPLNHHLSLADHLLDHVIQLNNVLEMVLHAQLISMVLSRLHALDWLFPMQDSLIMK